MREPTLGEVMVGSVAPDKVTVTSPGEIAYVSWHTATVNGTNRANVALRLRVGKVDDSQVLRAGVQPSQGDFVQSLPNQLDSRIRERGVVINGAQRQHLGPV